MLGKYPNLLGEGIKTWSQKRRAITLIATWRHLFVDDIRNIRATDLVEHHIPTYGYSKAVAAKCGLYTPEEEEYQKETIPALVDAGIIT